MRAGVLILTAVCAWLAAGVAQPPEPLPERQTTCWDCHAAADPRPALASLLDILFHEAGGAIGEPFDASVTFRNAWRHEVWSIDAALDLTDAPSLSFASGRPTERNDTLLHVAGGGTTSRGHATIEVPQGASRITIHVAPEGALLPPDIRLFLYPGQRAPEGTPVGPVDAPGTEESFSIESGPDGPLGGHGYGPWTVEVEVEHLNASRPSAQPPQDLSYRVRLEAEFIDTGERVQVRTSRDDLVQEQTVTLTWRLVPTAPPAPGEQARLTAVAHVHFTHATNQDDDEWTVKDLDLHVVDDGQVWLRSDGPGPTPPPVITGISLSRVGEAVGYLATFLLAASIVSGGVLGRASRRWLNRLFGAARRRVAFHNALSYGILLTAAVHLVLFVAETRFHWTLGLLWGGLGLLCLLALGATGATQVLLVRRWGFGSWRWTHLGLAAGAILFTIVHILLDGANFTAVQDAIGWQDPFQ